MPQKTRKDKPSPTASLKNITNTKARGSLNPKQKCVIKMQKIDIEILKTANDASDKDIKSTTKPLKRKPKRSDENLPSSKKKPPVVVQPAAPTTTTETPKTTNSSSSPSSSAEAAPAVARNEQSVENQIRKYEQLQKVISNKYVTVVDRLNLSYVPFCCENLEFCQRKHYKRAPSPKLPSANQMNLIRSALQQSRYNAFISLVWGLCLKDQFPGDIVLTNIIKLILSLNPEHQHNAFLQNIIDQLLCLFDVILKTFPPCWLALRKSYITFLRNTMEISRLFPDKPLNAENTIFEVILMLLEDNLDDGESIKQNRSLKKKRGSASAGSSSLALNNYDNEYYNMQHWEKNDNDEQTFSALSKDTQIERIMQVLHFLAKMLEMDMAMWMLRYHKNPAKCIYNPSTQPLVIELFALSEYKSSSVLVKKVMSLFSHCIEKDLNQNYLNIMDRFISLLANVQNLREVENTTAGIKYPIVGPRTSAFTMELYKTAEVNMKTSVRTYLRLVKNLNCPFVRYEYIDIFLKRLNPAAGKMGPQKIFENFRKRRWLECALDEERPLDESLSKLKSIVYRQDYLQIILEALRSYCDYFALKDFFQEFVGPTQTKEDNKNTLKNQAEFDPKQIKNQTQIDISSMRKNIVKLEKDLDMSTKMQVTKIDIPTLNIAVNAELLTQYRNDLKYVTNLHSYISALQHDHDEDFSEMIEFLKDFSPKC